MANIGQATFVGTDVIIECGEDMSCCQREQAKAKVDNYNSEIQTGSSRGSDPGRPGPLDIASSVTELTRKKENAQQRAWNKFRKEMDGAGSKAERQNIAKQNATSDCLAEKLADDWDSGGDNSANKHQINMDHQIESKWGGPADIDGLFALDTKVNTFFGSVSKNVGNWMLENGENEISSVSLVCTPPCKPPKAGDENKDYSTGPHTSFPSSPPNKVTTYRPGG